MKGKHTNTHTDFDVIVVGGGAVGGTLALALSKQGYRIALIEALAPQQGACDPERVVALSYGSRCHLQALGLWDGILKAGAGHIRHIDVREPDNHGLVQMHAEEVDVDALGYVVEINHITQVINEALLGQVTSFCPARVLAIHEHADSISVDMIQDGEKKSLSATLIVGADGTNSQVRSMANIGTHGWEYNRFALVTSVQCERNHADTAYECFRKSGPLAFLPLADGRFSIVWALAPPEAMRMLNLPEPMFLKRLQRAADESVLLLSGRMLSVGKRACFPVELRVAKEYARSRVALVGNAAHTVHPVAGQGMNLGLRDVAVLCNVLKTELAHGDAGNGIILKAYAEQRRLDVLAVAGFTESMLASFGNDFEPMKWLRSQGLSAMQMINPLKDGLLHHASGVAQMNKLSLVQKCKDGDAL